MFKGWPKDQTQISMFPPDHNIQYDIQYSNVYICFCLSLYIQPLPGLHPNGEVCAESSATIPGSVGSNHGMYGNVVVFLVLCIIHSIHSFIIMIM